MSNKANQQNQSPESPLPPELPKPKPEQGMSNYLTLLIAILVAILAGGLVWVYYSYYVIPDIENQSSNVSITIPEKESTTEDETTTDETADWEIYTNETYGFSFKYPTNWEIYDETSHPESAWDLNEKMRIVINGECEETNPECQQFGVFIHKKGIMEKTFSNYKVGKSDGEKIYGEKTWNKLLIAKEDAQGVGGISYEHILLYTNVNNNTYTITYNIVSDTQLFSNINQILSTFQFTE